MIRPEVRRALWRWREALAGGVAAALGLWWAATAYGALLVIGTALLVGGVLLAVAGVRRGLARRGGDGPGVVQVDEGQVGYFGPEEGGILALADVRRVSITGGPVPGWRLETDEWRLDVPFGAVGADALLDAFARLPGFDTARATGDAGARTIWVRDQGVVRRIGR